MMPLLISSAPYLASAALLIAASFLGWRLLSFWNLKNRSLTLAIYGLLVLATLVLCLLAAHYTSGWIFTAFGCALALALLGSTPSYTIKPEGRLIIPLTLILILLPLLIGAGSNVYHEVSLARAAFSHVTNLESSLLKQTNSNQQQAESLIALPAVQNLDTSATAFATLRQEALSRSLDFIIVTDAGGRVLMRTDQAGSSGDTITDRLPWTSQALAGQAIHGMAWDQNGQLVAAAAQPIMINSVQVGLLVVGNVIDTTYLKQHLGSQSVIIFDNQRLAAASTTTALDLSLAKNQGVATQSSSTVLVSLNSRTSLLRSATYATLDPSHTYQLVTLSDE